MKALVAITILEDLGIKLLENSANVLNTYSMPVNQNRNQFNTVELPHRFDLKYIFVKEQIH